MKKCGCCKNLKELLAFNRKRDAYQPLCRECQKLKQKEYYQKNREVFLLKERLRREEFHRWWAEFKATLKCCICSENHVACLDFHHRDSSTKEGHLASIVNGKWSKERILKEVEKCDVLCANCHRKHHYDEMLWKKKNSLLARFGSGLKLTPPPKKIHVR